MSRLFLMAPAAVHLETLAGNGLLYAGIKKVRMPDITVNMPDK
jgi:hypothetical protein